MSRVRTNRGDIIIHNRLQLNKKKLNIYHTSRNNTNELFSMIRIICNINLLYV